MKVDTADDNHAEGGRENFRGVYVWGQPSLCPYNYVWVVESDGVVELLLFVFDAAEINV